MQGSGPKKKDDLSRMDQGAEDLPQLSNEMQLSIMKKVKSGELSIEDALHQAKQAREQLLQQMSQAWEAQQSSQYNFSVHKHGRYRWQKRVLQLDFKTQMVCSIEKGIVKRQLAFSRVKSCDDGAGSRFSISFRDHHDYELEARSQVDKHKIMQLVNQIIYGNIYSQPVEVTSEGHPESPTPSQSILEGVLLLHRGGLASFKWVKYEAQLHPGQLILLPMGRLATVSAESSPPFNNSKVIHLSDGDTRVERSHSLDTFTLITHKNEFQFRVPITSITKGPMSIVQERDAWVQAIDRLCKDWKRKSQFMLIQDADLSVPGGKRGFGGMGRRPPPVEFEDIFLKSFPVQPGELKDKLFIVNAADGGLSDEQITSLRSPQGPTGRAAHCGPIHDGEDLQPLIDQMIRMCAALQGAGSFLAMLEYLLVVGNYLNRNAGKAAARGFRLSSLSKLSQLRGRDKDFTLLHALVEQIMLHQPGLLLLTQELAEFETAPGASIQGLTAEVDVLKKELQKVVHYRRTNKRGSSGDQRHNFSKELKMVIGKYKTDISVLSKKCDEMKKLYCDLLVKFGEPIDQDSQELFGCICQFLHDFQKVHAEFQ
ncbi:hypothetical protein NHX12_012835 [Muraenolepis orangiensis]|uniref:FH2 domain-containing protein n=1 Tax=Muraenolepis orangiensis TaxID=630683 RepID=A0A9Q0I4E1_9TELE|nr:hypothetical protein NHX12_012835 [Muraenolepis orangiensis]